MNDLLSKLSSYNLFNYLLPGIIFVVLAKELCGFSFVQQDIVLGVFLYYFIGLIISRVGSLIIEPLLIRTSFLRFVHYSDFVAASKKDEKIELLSEVNNSYRTFCSLFLLLGILKLYGIVENNFTALKGWTTVILLFLFLVMFLFSYKKQTRYITKRVVQTTKSSTNDEQAKESGNELD